MYENEYKSGDILFQEGDTSDYAFRIVSGAVDILKTVGGGVKVIGKAKTDSIVGEIAVLIDRNYTMTARAIEDGTKAQLLSKDEFLLKASRDPDTALILMNRMCDRLHAASRRSTDIPILNSARAAEFNRHPGRDGNPEAEAFSGAEKKLTVFPLSENLKGQIPKEGIIVMTSPFIVGRNPEKDELPREKKMGASGIYHGLNRRSHGERRKNNGIDPKTGLPKIHLYLKDMSPFRLSRVHFSIQKKNNTSYIVRDLGSSLGTKVNAFYLGTEFPRDFINLEMGDNIISVGGQHSPFVFRVALEEL